MGTRDNAGVRVAAGAQIGKKAGITHAKRGSNPSFDKPGHSRVIQLIPFVPTLPRGNENGETVYPETPNSLPY